MLEQEFENLLASYFEDELAESELITLRECVEGNPAYRRRFQRELRLHSLMREAALVRLENEDQSIQKRPLIFPGFGWVRIAAVAAVLIVCGLLTQLAWNQWSEPEKVGICLHLSDSDELTLWRKGKALEMNKNTILRAGDRITTGSQGQLTLKLEGVGILSLQVQTEIEFFTPGDRASVNVKRGLVTVEADKREPGTSPVLIRTPKAEVEVMGTVFGLEVNSTATRVRVHEGLVKFSNSASDRSVEVEAGQYSVNGGYEPKVFDQSELSPNALLPGQVRLLPVDDACSDGIRFLNGPYLKIEKRKRTSFLKFEVPNGGEIQGAKLRLTQSVDPGEGELKVWEGSHQDWSEGSISEGTLPKNLRLITQHRGWVGLDKIIELDVLSLVATGGTYTLVVTLEGGSSNDIWFGSKESAHPPELILTRQVK